MTNYEIFSKYKNQRFGKYKLLRASTLNGAVLFVKNPKYVLSINSYVVPPENFATAEHVRAPKSIYYKDPGRFIGSVSASDTPKLVRDIATDAGEETVNVFKDDNGTHYIITEYLRVYRYE